MTIPLFQTRALCGLAISLWIAGCAGGSGGTGGTALAPPAAGPPAPTVNASIAAPSIAKVPNANLFPAATDAGPTMQSHGSTVFPLLQTSVSIVPGSVTADNPTINAGGTLTTSSALTGADFNLGNAAAGVTNVHLNVVGTKGTLQGTGAEAKAVFVHADQLSWTSYGYWQVEATDRSLRIGEFVTGYATPVAAIPTSGSATYTGKTDAQVMRPSGQSALNGVSYGHVTGDASLAANFGTGVVTGNLTNLITTSFEGDTEPWNSVSLSATIAGGQNLFTGTSAVTSTPANSLAMGASATGTVAGMFFGPKANEVGAVWTLFDGTGAAMGMIGGTGVYCASCGAWDY